MGCNDCNEHKHDCNSCSTGVEQEICPLCAKQGLAVLYETVESLIDPMIRDDVSYYSDEEFYLCKSRDCKVSYYTSNGARLFTDQLTVPIWYKGKPERYIVCYCRDITLNDIIQAVNSITGNINDLTIEDVCRYLEKPIESGNCIHKNPTGKCCTPLFNNAIEYAKTQFKL